MPRDATETRSRLIAEAERLFADQGIWRVRVQDIVAAAGQRNSLGALLPLRLPRRGARRHPERSRRTHRPGAGSGVGRG